MAENLAELNEENNDNSENDKTVHDIDSKYRLILLAAQRTKQLQRGAQPRIDSDPHNIKNTRIALEEIRKKKVPFEFTKE